MNLELIIIAEGGNERIPFSISEGDIEDAIAEGRTNESDGLDRQVSCAAYHRIMELAVSRRVLEEAWVAVRNGRIIARNHLALGITEADL